MAFGKTKAGKHHSANQVRQGYKAQRGRRSRKHFCSVCDKLVGITHDKENPDHVRP